LKVIDLETASPPASESPMRSPECTWWLPEHMSSLAGSQREVAASLEGYRPTGRLGTGLFSKVWLLEPQEGGKRVALKVIDKAGIAAAKLDVKEYIAREIQALKLAQSSECPFLCRLEQNPAVVEDGAQAYLPLVAHLGGELLLQVAGYRKLEEPAARFHVACVALALGALHKLQACYLARTAL